MNLQRFFALTAATAFTLLAAPASATVNHLFNAGFEFDAFPDQDPLPGASDWSTFGNSNTASTPGAPARTGVGSLQLVGAGGFTVPGAFQTYPAKPGQIWDLQGYILTTDPLDVGATRGLVKIVFSDGAFDLEPAAVFIGEADAQPFPGIISTPQLTIDSTPNTWQFTQAQGVAPEGTIQVSLFALFVDENPGTAYFDDLQAILAGDFDADFDIDADDLTLWTAAYGQTAGGDADGDNDSDGADFLLWQRSLSPAGATTAAIGAVPEPSAALLLGAGLALAGLRRVKKLSL